MRRPRLVAEARADCNLMAALGAPAAQHRCARLGLHPGKEPVGLRAVAAVRVKGTLRHLTSTPCSIFWHYNSLQVYPKFARCPKESHRAPAKKRLYRYHKHRLSRKQ